MSVPLARIQLPMDEVHRRVGDLWTVDGLGEVISAMRLYRDVCEVQLYAKPIVEGRALQIARSLLDGATVRTKQVESDDYPAIHIIVTGTYREVPLHVVSVVTDQASRNIIRDLRDDRVIDALAGGDVR